LLPVVTMLEKLQFQQLGLAILLRLSTMTNPDMAAVSEGRCAGQALTPLVAQVCTDQSTGIVG
jgi:hypothetical protein